MKIVVLIAGIALGVFLIARLQQPAKSPRAVVVPAASTAAVVVSAPAPSALRQPIARTQSVLKEVEARTGAGEF